MCRHDRRVGNRFVRPHAIPALIIALAISESVNSTTTEDACLSEDSLVNHPTNDIGLRKDCIVVSIVNYLHIILPPLPKVIETSERRRDIYNELR